MPGYCCSPHIMNLSFNGIMRTPTGVTDRESEYASTRFELRNAWNGNASKAHGVKPFASSPFRVVFNATNISNISVIPNTYMIVLITQDLRSKKQLKQLTRYNKRIMYIYHNNKSLFN